MPYARSGATATAAKAMRMPSKSVRPSARLDVRPLPTWERHLRIRTAFEGLTQRARLTIVTDHEPRPLRLEFEQHYRGRYVWLQRQLGLEHWEVELRSVAPGEAPDPLTDFLRRCPLLCDAAQSSVAALRAVARELRFGKGSTVVEQDAHWPHVGLLESGTLAAVIGSRSGREQTLYDILPCDTFGEAEALDGSRSIVRIVTEADASIVVFPAAAVATALTQDIGVATALVTSVAQRSRALAERLRDQRAQPAIARVAAAILPYASPDAGLAPSLQPLRRMTQAQLAAVAGTATEVAARAIAQLEAAGAVQRVRGRIAKVDRHQLAKFV